MSTSATLTSALLGTPLKIHFMPIPEIYNVESYSLKTKPVSARHRGVWFGFGNSLVYYAIYVVIHRYCDLCVFRTTLNVNARYLILAGAELFSTLYYYYSNNCQ